MVNSDSELLQLAAAIVANDIDCVGGMIATSPHLATDSFQAGATRQSATDYFLKEIARQIYAGDTALHIAAAAHQPETARTLISAGAQVNTRNRRGQQPLHYAAVGSPGSPIWNPAAQVATIQFLVAAGANPNAVDMDGVSPLHRAVRTRSAEGVRTLLDCGADPTIRNKSGSTPMVLAVHNTGRPGSGSPEAKSQQQMIVRLLEERNESAGKQGAR